MYLYILSNSFVWEYYTLPSCCYACVDRDNIHLSIFVFLMKGRCGIVTVDHS